MEPYEKFSPKSTHKFALCGFLYPEIIQLKSDFAYVMFYLLEEGTLVFTRTVVAKQMPVEKLFIFNNEK